MSRPHRPGLYAIANCDGVEASLLLDRITACLDAGASIVQLRAKQTPAAELVSLARRVKAHCAQSNALLIINDNPEVARSSGADGVHIGRNDLDCRVIRAEFGQSLVVGVSCYALLDRAAEAVAAGADYIAFGSIFASPTKPNAPRCGLDTLETARRRFELPIVAIGGITPQNAAAVVAAGADYVAVISGIFDMDDPGAATLEYLSAIKPPLVQ